QAVLEVTTVIVDEVQLHRRPGVVVPDLVGRHPVERRKLPGLEQKVDGGRCRARPSRRLRDELRAKGLDVVAAFGMQLQPKALNEIGGRQARHGSPVYSTDRFAASAIPMKTAQRSELPRHARDTSV